MFQHDTLEVVLDRVRGVMYIDQEGLGRLGYHDKIHLVFVDEGLNFWFIAPFARLEFCNTTAHLVEVGSLSFQGFPKLTWVVEHVFYDFFLDIRILPLITMLEVCKGSEKTVPIHVDIVIAFFVTWQEVEGSPCGALRMVNGDRGIFQTF